MAPSHSKQFSTRSPIHGTQAYDYGDEGAKVQRICVILVGEYRVKARFDAKFDRKKEVLEK